MFESSTVLEELDGEATAAFIAERHRALVEAEADLIAAAVHFADIHNGDALDAAGERLPGMERAVRRGGPGTPTVAEFAHTEIAAIQGMHPASGAALIADGQDLVHRLPQLWARTREGQVRVWKARKVAAWTRQLSLEQAAWVDAQIADYATSLPFSRFESLVRAKIIEVDPEAEEARREAAEAERFVRTGRSNDHGVKTLIVKAAAGEVIWFVAMCDRIAHILKAQGATDAMDVLRSKAVGLLAQPARALQLITAFEASLDQSTPPPTAASEDPADPLIVSEDDLHPSQNDAAEDSPRRTAPSCPACVGRSVGPIALPPATLYVHIAAESLERPGTGVARLEGHGPISVDQIKEFLGASCSVTIKPVIDLNDCPPVDGYEVPTRLREALHLRNPADAFPFANGVGRNADIDHTIAYLAPSRGGPPGQTRLENLGKLSRFHHRLKTHGRWRLRQPEPGTYLWRSPYGRYFLVDHDGNRPLPTCIGDAAWLACDPATKPIDVDLVPATFAIDYRSDHAA